MVELHEVHSWRCGGHAHTNVIVSKEWHATFFYCLQETEDIHKSKRGNKNMNISLSIENEKRTGQVGLLAQDILLARQILYH